MVASWKLDRCRQAIHDLSRDELPWQVLSGGIVRHVRKVAGFDGWCFSLTDPVTGLPTAAAVQDSPLSSCQRRFWQLEYLAPDAGTADARAAARRGVTVLSQETGGDLARSRRWDELLRPAGTADELRAVLKADGVPWGSLTLYRAGTAGGAGEPGRFSADDVRTIETLRDPLTRAARTSWTTAPRAPADSDAGPATLITTMDGTLIDATPTADAQLRRLGLYRQAGYALMYALLARLTADMNGDGGHRAAGPASASVLTRTADGRWAVLHAAPLAGFGGAAGCAAVTIQPAPSARVRAVLLRAYALSERERQVATLAIDGLQAKEIAAALHISPHTARDHLKVIFRKTRSHARQELAARLGGSAP